MHSIKYHLTVPNSVMLQRQRTSKNNMWGVIILWHNRMDETEIN